MPIVIICQSPAIASVFARLEMPGCCRHQRPISSNIRCRSTNGATETGSGTESNEAPAKTAATSASSPKPMTTRAKLQQQQLHREGPRLYTRSGASSVHTDKGLVCTRGMGLLYVPVCSYSCVFCVLHVCRLSCTGL